MTKEMASLSLEKSKSKKLITEERWWLWRKRM